MYLWRSISLWGSLNILYTLFPFEYFCWYTFALGLSNLGGRTSLVVLLFNLWCCTSLSLLLLLLLLLLSTLGLCTSTSDTLGWVGVLLVNFWCCWFNKFENTLMVLLVLLLVNGISQFCFDFITAVNSSSAFVAQFAAVFPGSFNFDGMNIYVSLCLFPCVVGIQNTYVNKVLMMVQ